MVNNFIKDGGRVVARSIMKAFREQAIKAGYRDEDVLLKAWANNFGFIEPFPLDTSKKDSAAK